MTITTQNSVLCVNTHWGHGCLCVVSVVSCQVEVSATKWSLVQRSPTDCGVSECALETSWMSRPRPIGDSHTKNKPTNKKISNYDMTFFSHSYRAAFWYYQSFIYSPTDALVSCVKNNIKIYIKICVKRAPTCFGVTVTQSSESTLICVCYQL